jgi:drug/metabolite transporter (DMT)-like permease
MMRSARLAVLAAAVLFSTGGAAVKVAAFTIPQVSGFRSGIAALTLLAWYHRDLAWTRWTAPAALAYAAMLTLYVAATRFTTAANAIFLQSTAPIYVLLLSPVLLGERVTRRDVEYLVTVAFGMVLCFFGQTRATATASDPALGNVLAAGSGVFWGLTLIALRHFSRDSHRPASGNAGITVVVVGNGLAFLAAIPWMFPMPKALPVEWATLVYLGVFQVGLAYVCLMRAARRLPALEVSLLLLFEPVLNPLWTWIIRDEVPGRWTVAGGAVILGATAFRTWRSRSG